MTRALHLWPDEGQTRAGSIRRQVTLEGGGPRRTIWYELAGPAPDVTTGGLDGLVVGVLFTAMQERRELTVHGPVSRTLLRNLHEFQHAWHCWLPREYAVVDITPAEELTGPGPGRPSRAIAAFSGGVDAVFSVLRHRRRAAGSASRDVAAGLLIQGFDIPLADRDSFAVVERSARQTLDSLGIPLLTVKTNLRERLTLDWEDACGAAIASCLHQFAGAYGEGLIGASEPYDHLILPWGSNPITDPLLSGRDLSIIHDGAAFSRTEKVEHIARWPEACRNLRVCWEGARSDGNCGRCEKCIRTALNFLAAGAEPPASLGSLPRPAMIRAMRLRNAGQVSQLMQLLAFAHERGIEHELLVALEERLAACEGNPAPRHRPGRHPLVRAAYRRLRATKKWLSP